MAAATKTKEKPKAEKVELSTGKFTTSPTVEIKCAKPGCTVTRVIKKQDKFQVKHCIPHQKEHRNELRRKRRKASAKAKSSKSKAKGSKKG